MHSIPNDLILLTQKELNSTAVGAQPLSLATSTNIPGPAPISRIFPVVLIYCSRISRL
jgi:hypothetical protein